MPQVNVKTPDGKVVTVNAPEDATENDILAYVAEQYNQQQPYAKGRKETSTPKRVAATAMQGPLLGFGDELLGLSSAVIRTPFNDKSFAENYLETRDYTRGMQDAYREEHPLTTPVMQTVAAMPLIAKNVLGRGVEAVGKVVAPNLTAKYQAMMAPQNQLTGVVPRIVHAAGTGGVYGTVGGAGESKAPTLGGMAVDALEAGGKSAIVSGGMSSAAIPTIAAARQIHSRFSPKAAGNFAQEKVAEGIVRDARGKVFEDGTSNAATQAVRRMEKMGQEARVVDAGGQNTRQLLDTVTTLPGRTKNATEAAIRTRQATRADRMTDAADSALGARGKKYDVTIEALAEQRRQAAQPYYDQLKGRMVPVDDGVDQLLRRTKSVHKDAEKLFELQNGFPLDLSSLGKGKAVPFETLDILKRSLYDAAEAAKRAGNKTLGAEYDSARKALISKMDDISPKDAQGQSIYKQARDAFAGPSQMMDAAEIGRKSMREDVFDVKVAIRAMSDSEKEAFKVGALQALREKVGTQSGQTSILKMWMDKSTRDRLKVIFGNDYRKFADFVAKESKLKGMETVGRGSQTASRQFAAGDLDVSPLASAANVTSALATNNPMGVVGSLANAWNRVQTPESVRDQMGRILLSQNPADLRSLEFLIPQINAARQRSAGYLGGFSGVAIPGLLNQNQ